MEATKLNCIKKQALVQVMKQNNMKKQILILHDLTNICAGYRTKLYEPEVQIRLLSFPVLLFLR
jgi:hypothetical protein